MRILGQPGGDVVDERCERIDAGGLSHPGGRDTVEVVADRSAVLSGVAGNGRDRPASFMQSVYLQVVLPCEHEKAGLLQIAGAWSETPSIEGAPPSSAEPHR